MIEPRKCWSVVCRDGQVYSAEGMDDKGYPLYERYEECGICKGAGVLPPVGDGFYLVKHRGMPTVACVRGDGLWLFDWEGEATEQGRSIMWLRRIDADDTSTATASPEVTYVRGVSPAPAPCERYHIGTDATFGPGCLLEGDELVGIRHVGEGVWQLLGGCYIDSLNGRVFLATVDAFAVSKAIKGRET